MLKKSLVLSLAGIVAFVFSGCGTLFYPERKTAAASTQIDPTVLILDCCGLLFGIIPGAVALILDFNNNTIYFTKSEVKNRTSVDSLDRSEMIAVHVDKMDRESIEAAIAQQVGHQISLDDIQLARIQ